MASVLIHTAEENVTLSAQAAKKLLEKGDSDAALLYIALLRHHGNVPPRSLAGELRWERGRIESAEETLRQLGLIAASAAEVPEPADEKPEYQRADIMEHLSGNDEFRRLVAEVEKRLGKRLTTPDVGVLLGLNDYLGLPADVIYLLVCHCAERVQRKYGEGRRPTLRQIEKEGYYWARLGVDTHMSFPPHVVSSGLLPIAVSGSAGYCGSFERASMPARRKIDTASQANVRIPRQSRGIQ